MGISSEMSFVYILFLELYDFHQSLNMRGHELRKRAAPVNREEMDTALWSSSWQQKAAVWRPGNGQERAETLPLVYRDLPVLPAWHDTAKLPFELKNNVNRIQQLGLPWWLSATEFTCQCRKTWVRSLVSEDATCLKATKLVCHNYSACALESRSHSCWAQEPQLLKPKGPRAHAL